MGRIVEVLAKNSLQSLAPLAAFMVAFEGNPLAKLGVALGAVVTIVVIVAFLRYWFFHYAITGRSILIRDGILKKKQLDIGFERIQAVNTRQNILFRWLGLVTVTFDSAGSAAEEGYLPAVRLEAANALRNRVRPPSGSSAPRDATEPPRAKRLLQLHAGDITLAGLSSGRIFLLLALLGPLAERAGREVDRRVEDNAVIEAITSIGPDAATGLWLLFALAAAVLVVLLFSSVLGAFLRFHGFTLTADGEVLRATGGLLTRHEHSVNRGKVQSLAIVQNAALRLSRRFRLRIRQASGARTAIRRDFLVPICRREHLGSIGLEIFREEFRDSPLDPSGPAFQPISPDYVRSRITLFGLLPSLVGTISLWAAAGPAASFALLWIPACSLIVWRRYRRYGFAILADGFALRSGLIGARVILWLHRKVQGVTIHRSPFQRRRNLASVRMHLAGGAVHIPFIDLQSAQELRDYVLYRVESSERAWH